MVQISCDPLSWCKFFFSQIWFSWHSYGVICLSALFEGTNPCVHYSGMCAEYDMIFIVCGWRLCRFLFWQIYFFKNPVWIKWVLQIFPSARGKKGAVLRVQWSLCTQAYCTIRVCFPSSSILCKTRCTHIVFSAVLIILCCLNSVFTLVASIPLAAVTQ